MLTALAFVLILGDAERFHCGKQVASYLGLVPLEESSGNRRRLGHITKQACSIPAPLLVSRAGDSAQPAGVAQQILSSGAAARTEDRESRHGPPIGCAVVLDDAQAMGL